MEGGRGVQFGCGLTGSTGTLPRSFTALGPAFILRRPGSRDRSQVKSRDPCTRGVPTPAASCTLQFSSLLAVSAQVASAGAAVSIFALPRFPTFCSLAWRSGDRMASWWLSEGAFPPSLSRSST